ncbi:FACT complex subunit SSRP1 [Tanacetum coccineum]
MHNPGQLKVHSGVLWKKQGGGKAVEVNNSNISALTWMKVPRTNQLFIRTKDGLKYKFTRFRDQLLTGRRLEDQYFIRAAQKACSLAYYCLSNNHKARPLMTDIVETLEPLQGNCTGDAAITFISPLTGYGSASGGYTEYQSGRRHGPLKDATSPVLTLHVDDNNVNRAAIATALAYLYGNHPKLDDSNA